MPRAMTDQEIETPPTWMILVLPAALVGQGFGICCGSVPKIN